VVHLDHHVALLEASLGRRAALAHVGDHRPLLVAVDAEATGELGRERLELEAELGAVRALAILARRLLAARRQRLGDHLDVQRLAIAPQREIDPLSYALAEDGPLHGL
jgi:hypothetical protein